VALPDLTAVKARLRIENDVEDDDLEIMRESAAAFIEEYIGRPIAATERTFTIEGIGPENISSGKMFLPMYPVLHDGDDLVTITDADDEAFTDFRVNTQTGMIVATEGTRFDNFPYTVTATVGLELLPGYSTRVEPNLSQAFLDLCSDWYQRRNPGAFTEAAGGGVMTQWLGQGAGGQASAGVPSRVMSQLTMYQIARVF
jgi:hypothetical protein